MTQFLLYCLCGGIGVSSDYAVYHLAFSEGLWYQFANGLGYLSGTLVSFFLNRVITFGVRDQLIRRLLIFIGVAALGFGTSAILLWFFVEVSHLDARLAKLLTLPVVILLQFTLNRRITFTMKNTTSAAVATDF